MKRGSMAFMHIKTLMLFMLLTLYTVCVFCVCVGGDKHCLLSQVVRSQAEPLPHAPPPSAAMLVDDRPGGHWKDEERRGGGAVIPGDKREGRGSRHDDRGGG